MGSIVADVKNVYLKDHPDQLNMLTPFLNGFDIKYADEKRLNNTTVFVYLLKPEQFISDAFGIDREIMLAYSKYETFQPRALQAINMLFDIYPFKNRVDSLTCFIVSKDPSVGENAGVISFSDKQSRSFVTFVYDELLANRNDSWYVRNVLRKNFYDVDLFGYTLPLRDETSFFGRQQVISRYIDAIKRGENRGVFGVRKTGKTSLLFKIDRIVPSADLVKLDIEKKKSKQLQLEAKTIGEPKEGFIVGEINTDENLIKISGAESIVDRVSKAEVDLDVTGLQTDIGSNEDIVLYDKDGEVVDSTNLEMKTRSVKVNVPILQTKKVPVRYRISGKTADGYAQTGDIDSNPGEVLIAGKKSVLSTVDAIIVEGEDLDVTGLKDNFTYTADLKQFLPAGVVFADDKFDGKATVVVYIGSVSESTVDVSTKNIAVEGVPEGFEVTIDSNGEDDKVSLTLAGLDSRINTLNNSALRGTINIEQVMKDNNLTELAEGSYRAEVEWNLPKGVEVKNTVSVHISVKKAD